MSQALIIGASGLVGSYIQKLAPDKRQITGTYRNFPLPGLVKLEIDNKEEIKKLIATCKPDLIFLPAAFTNVDTCEESPDLCYKINVEGVRGLTDILKDLPAKLVYFSTDYVFNGACGPYSEDDLPQPLGVYGRSKLEAEKIIKNTLKDYLIIRTTCVYGWEPQGKNFIVNLIKKNKSGQELEVPTDQSTTPTYAGHLAGSSWMLAMQDKTGIYNVAGSSLMSRFDFALMTAEVFGLDKKLIKPVTTGETKRKAKRPLNGGLRTDKIKKELNTVMPSAKEGLEAMEAEAKK